MKTFIEAIKTRDLTLIEKEFSKIMEAKKSELLEKQRVKVASSVIIEGEEIEDDEEDPEDDEDEDKDEKETDE